MRMKREEFIDGHSEMDAKQLAGVMREAGFYSKKTGVHDIRAFIERYRARKHISTPWLSK